MTVVERNIYRQYRDPWPGFGSVIQWYFGDSILPENDDRESQGQHWPKYAVEGVGIHPKATILHRPRSWGSVLENSNTLGPTKIGLRQLLMQTHLLDSQNGSDRLDYVGLTLTAINQLTLSHMTGLEPDFFRKVNHRRALGLVVNTAVMNCLNQQTPWLSDDDSRMQPLIDQVIQPYIDSREVHPDFESGMIFIPQAVVFLLDQD